MNEERLKEIKEEQQVLYAKLTAVDKYYRDIYVYEHHRQQLHTICDIQDKRGDIQSSLLLVCDTG